MTDPATPETIARWKMLLDGYFTEHILSWEQRLRCSQCASALTDTPTFKACGLCNALLYPMCHCPCSHITMQAYAIAPQS